MDNDESEECSRQVLNATKRVYSEMRKLESVPSKVENTQIAEWKGVMAAANKEIARLLKRLKSDSHRQLVERSVMKEEMRCELVDREANTARTADRFRVLFEQNGGNGRSPLDRARWSNSAIECSIACLCPHPVGVSAGSMMLSSSASNEAGNSRKRPHEDSD